MHVVCKNPETPIKWKLVAGPGDLRLATYTNEELEEAGTSCAKECAAEAKCVAYEQLYDEDWSRVEGCAPAHVQICTGALHICDPSCCSLLPLPVLAPRINGTIPVLEASVQWVVL
jgi:hypothetical protein